MKKVLNNYSSKNDINIRQIVAYKDNVLEIEEYREGFSKEDTMNIMSRIRSLQIQKELPLFCRLPHPYAYLRRIPGYPDDIFLWWVWYYLPSKVRYHPGRDDP